MNESKNIDIMEEQKVKHLEMIQGIINRMNQNSFMLKGWMITIVSALLVIYADKGNIVYLIVTIFPILVFWFLDAYYLQQERKFRGVYNDIVCGEDIALFNMPIKEYNRKKDCKYSYCNVFWSKTIAGLYCTILVIVLITLLYILLKDCVTITCTC